MAKEPIKVPPLKHPEPKWIPDRKPLIEQPERKNVPVSTPPNMPPPKKEGDGQG